jgi:maltose alpha-D-glucosyltransferase / alpha-amylase
VHGVGNAPKATLSAAGGGPARRRGRHRGTGTTVGTPATTTRPGPKLPAARIACHGNFHLQQVLCTGDDFTIIDFEGEPPRPLFERRLKRTPLVDVASMVRSFHYAARVVLSEPGDAGRSRFWRHWSAAAFLRAYRSTSDPQLLPLNRTDLYLLFEVTLIERTLYELGYELDHRPDWAGIPLADLREMLEEVTDS